MKKILEKAIGLILLIVITSLVLAFLVAGKFYISAFVAGMILLIEALVPARQMERSDRLFRHFVWSVRYSDSFLGHNTPRNRRMPLPQELTEAVEEALQFYKKHLQQKESQLHISRRWLNHIDLSVFVYSPETGQVEWMKPGSQNTKPTELCRNDRRPGSLPSGTSCPAAHPASR